MARLALSLLGPLQLTLDEQPVSGMAYDKVRALLAYLALEVRPHRREVLAELLWPEQEAAAARTSLRVALNTLRRALGDQSAQPPFLLISRETVQFNPASDYTLDMTRFTGLLRESEQHAHPRGALCASCVERLTEAVALYRGELLQQVLVRDSVAYDEWLTLTRERLHHQALDALAQLAAYHEARGEDEQARQYAWRTLALEGWDEAAYRCLMRILARSGQRAAALAQYERCRTVLAEELGVEPAAETTALYEQIRSGPLAAAVGARPEVVPSNPSGRPHPQAAVTASPEPQLHAAPPTNLPTPPTSLIGREREVAAVRAQLQRADMRLLTLTGPPGVGKTRLALQTGAVVRDLFADGVFFVPLAPISDPDLVVTAIAQSLDVKEMGGQSLIERVQATLRDKQLLLVLDNFEQVVEAAPRIAELLMGCPALKVLVTSRVVLRLSGEHEFPLAPLALPDLQHLPPVEALAQLAAVALFVERVRAVKPDFALTTENARAVAEICARVGGLPLAIELVAARVKLFSPQALLARLDRRLNLLTSGARDLPARQQTLRSTIDWSYYLLNAGEQTLFVRLGVFVGGFTLEAAEAVCNADGDLPWETLDGLAALIDQSLLRQDANGSALRFTMLETIREYALERLAERGEADAIRQQHADFFLALAEEADHWLRRPEREPWMERLAAEHDNLRTALAWFSKPEEIAQGLRLAAALSPFWGRHSHFTEGRRWLEGMLEKSSSVAAAIRAKALLGAGQLAGGQSDYATARTYAEESLTLFRAVGDQLGSAWALHSLGTIVFDHGEYTTARTYAEESLALFRAVGDQLGSARTQHLLGCVAMVQGDDLVQAVAYFEANLAFYHQTGDKGGIAVTLDDMATVAQLQGDWERAVAFYAESLAIARELGHRWHTALFLHNLGGGMLHQGHARPAAAYFAEGLALSRDIGYPDGILKNLAGMAGVAAVQARPARSVRLFGAAEALFAAMDMIVQPVDRAEYDRNLVIARAQLDEATFTAAWAAGRALSLEQAIAEALEWSKAATSTAGSPPPQLPPPTNLPAPPTPLIGRERELVDLSALLRRPEVRLVTLTGAGGSGKTRLALELAAVLQDAFPDGVFLVELALVRQADLVAATIATTLGLKDAGGQPLVGRLIAYLRERRMLLLLDNFEHVLEAAPLLATLLGGCRSPTLLVTSRAPLHLRGEREVEVAPLAVPDLQRPPSPDPEIQTAAVRLFVARAQDVRPDFLMTPENAASINEICVRLDGLPLALELAAARIKLLSPQSLLARLGSRMQLLTTGARDLPARQQTLRKTLDWSYHLLNAGEQALFARMGVFVGGCTLEAAEAVGNADHDLPIDVLEGVAALVDKSLLRQAEGKPGEPRFTMLETIREYALERLAASDKESAVRQRHAMYFLALVEEAELKLRGVEQPTWLDRLEQDRDNLRAVLEWSLTSENVEIGLRFAGELWQFWKVRGYFSEGRDWLARLLALPHSHDIPTWVRGKALHVAGTLASQQGDYTQAGELLAESLALFRTLDDKQGMAWALNELGQLPYRQSAFEQAQVLFEESLALFRERDDKRGMAEALDNLGRVARMLDDYARATTLFQESLDLFRELGDDRGIAIALKSMGTVAYLQGDYPAAHALYEEGLTLFRTLGDPWGIALTEDLLGEVARRQGDDATARTFYEESLALRRELGDKKGMAFLLRELGTIAHQQGHDRHAHELLTNSLILFRELGNPGNIARALNQLGHVVLAQGDGRQAASLFRESVALFQEARQESRQQLGIAEALTGLARVAQLEGQAERAARLLAAVEAACEAESLHALPRHLGDSERWIDIARVDPSEEAFAAAWAEGRAMTLEQAIAYALNATSPAPPLSHPLRPIP